MGTQGHGLTARTSRRIRVTTLTVCLCFRWRRRNKQNIRYMKVASSTWIMISNFFATYSDEMRDGKIFQFNSFFFFSFSCDEKKAEQYFSRGCPCVCVSAECVYVYVYVVCGSDAENVMLQQHVSRNRTSVSACVCVRM